MPISPPAGRLAYEFVRHKVTGFPAELPAVEARRLALDALEGELRRSAATHVRSADADFK